MTAPDIIVEREPDGLVRFAQATNAGQIFSEPDPEFDLALKECLRLALETP